MLVIFQSKNAYSPAYAWPDFDSDTRQIVRPKAHQHHQSLLGIPDIAGWTEQYHILQPLCRYIGLDS